MLNDKTAKLLRKEEKYPDRANFPADVYVYECACGKGFIEYVAVSGFDDRYATVCCEDCSSKYEVKTGCGCLWELTPR